MLTPHPTLDELPVKRLVCTICPRHCALKPGQRGFCYVRRASNNGETIELTAYGHTATGLINDPIEKKPLYHFYPGSEIYSFGTLGCNLACKFCQNWHLSAAARAQEPQELLRTPAYTLSPPEIITYLQRAQATALAFTYNEPTIFYEYVRDTAQLCREQQLRTVVVSAGYTAPEILPSFYEFIDAANIDLKAFNEKFYRRFCNAHLEPVLETLLYLKKATTVWFEITNLLIPGENDSPADLRALTNWIVDNLGADVPLHFSAFHPAHQLYDYPPTSLASLQRAKQIAQAAGLRYVYLGNIHAASHTYCPQCQNLLIARQGYEISTPGLLQNICQTCQYKLPGRFNTKA